MAGPGRVVIVGAGLAAVRTIQQFRQLGGTSEIILIGDEQHAPYDRPPLSKQVLRGEEDVRYLHDDWSSLDVDLRLGQCAVGLDSTQRVVLFADGSELQYEALVVATGVRPRTVPELEGQGAYVLRTIDDARRLANAIRERGRVTIVGGGFIGCEVAASARGMGAEVTIVETLPGPLVGALGESVAREIAQMHIDAGVELRCGVRVLESVGDNGNCRLSLSDGSAVSGTPTLLGIGSAPETSWLNGSGIDVDDGVLCDERGRTTAESVWAVGDVARWYQPALERYARVEHWTNAAEQGAVVANDLIGNASGIDSVPYVWSDQYSVKLQVLGLPHHSDDVTIMRVGPEGDRLLALYERHGRFTGVAGASAARWVMRLRPLLSRGAQREEAMDVVKSTK